jgi:hypothetical protein
VGSGDAHPVKGAKTNALAPDAKPKTSTRRVFFDPEFCITKNSIPLWLSWRPSSAQVVDLISYTQERPKTLAQARP